MGAPCFYFDIAFEHLVHRNFRKGRKRENRTNSAESVQEMFQNAGGKSEDKEIALGTQSYTIHTL